MAEMTVFGGGQESPDSPRLRGARRLLLASPLLFLLVRSDLPAWLCGQGMELVPSRGCLIDGRTKQ